MYKDINTDMTLSKWRHLRLHRSPARRAGNWALPPSWPSSPPANRRPATGRAQTESDWSSLGSRSGQTRLASNQRCSPTWIPRRYWLCRCQSWTPEGQCRRCWLAEPCQLSGRPGQENRILYNQHCRIFSERLSYQNLWFFDINYHTNVYRFFHVIFHKANIIYTGK